MKQNKKRSAFTLIELLVGISIITILGTGISNINFNTINHKQNLEIFANKIISNFETARNNALLGKGIGASLVIPDTWEIIITQNGGITFEYNNGTPYDELNIIPENNYIIETLTCLELDGNSNNTPNSQEIQIKGSNLNFVGGGGGCDTSEKILKIDTSYGQFTKTIEINILSGLATIY